MIITITIHHGNPGVEWYAGVDDISVWGEAAGVVTFGLEAATDVEIDVMLKTSDIT